MTTTAMDNFGRQVHDRMEHEEDNPKRRLRFSLRTLLLVTTFVAMLVCLLVSTRNNRRLAETNQALVRENRRLRDEVGELSIEDESRLHAIQVPADNNLEWTWRVWVPKGKKYRLRYVTDRIPKQGWPSGGATMDFSQAGEQVIRYRIRRSPTSNRFCGMLSSRAGSTTSGDFSWVEWPSSVGESSGVGTSTVAYPANHRVELFRYRVSQAKASEAIEDPAAGFILWLEPVP